MRTDPSSGQQPMDATAAQRMRLVAREIFKHTLQQSSIDRAFDHHLGYERGILRVSDDLYDLDSFSKVVIVSIGKAGNTAVESLMNRLGAGVGVSGIVCSPTDPGSQVFGFRYFKGGHPLPNLESLKSAESILRLLESLSDKSLVIYLISGGGSSLVEKPAFESISLEDLVDTYRALVHCGAPIAEINTLRKHLSAVKGGRLAQAAYPAHQVSILISDVPENALDSLASGPTMPDSSTMEQCYEIVERYRLLPEFPPSVREIFQNRLLEETPKKDDPSFVKARWWTVLSNLTAQHAAVEKAAVSGFAIEIDNSVDDKDYRVAADHLLRRVRELRKGVSSVCLISGGEVTVQVKGESGAGGRNQQLALYCAERIAGENITVLSAGTDGIDGNSTAAGAVVDGSTVERARAKGLNIRDALDRFDAYPLFDRLGDTIVTGPTGNNLRDLRILLAY